MPLLPAAQADLPDLGAIPQYNIDVRVADDRRTFDAGMQLSYTNLEDVPLDRLYLRLLPNGHSSYGNGLLVVEEVQVDGQPAETSLSPDLTALDVHLPSALAPGENARLTITFNGVVPLDFGGEDTPAGYGIYNLANNVLALSGWYPVLAVYDEDGWNLDPVSPIGDSLYSDMAYYTVRLNAPADQIVAATGVVVDEQKESGRKTYQIESGPARDFFIIMSQDFEIASQTVDGTQVNSYFLPGHKDAGQQALDIAVGSLLVYNERFGIYPYTELDVVEAPMRNAAGVEFPGTVLIGAYLYDDPEQVTFAIATAHEVAHQWWYNIVGNDVFDDPWLDEALTSYVSSLYYEFGPPLSTPDWLIDNWQSRYEDARSKGGDDLITESLAHFESLENPGLYGAIVYRKGALFFDALRKEIGDRAFFEALRNYYHDYQYKIARPENLLDAFEEAAGRSLDDFYQEWLYSIPQ